MSQKSRRGFTTVETLITVAIIGILSSIALSKVDVASFKARSSAQTLGTTMVAAQREAITKQHDIILTFNAANRQVLMTWDRNSNTVVNGGERVRAIVLDENIAFGLGGAPARGFGSNPINFNRIVNGLPALIFHRNGSASGIGGFYLTTTRAAAAAAAGSTAKAKDTRAVEIVRATGRTEWFRYSGTTWKREF